MKLQRRGQHQEIVQEDSTEMERLKQKQENTEMELERKKRRLEEKQILRIEKKKIEEEKIKKKEQEKKKRQMLKEAQLEARMGLLHKNRVCISCRQKVNQEDTTDCVLCDRRYHKCCMKESIQSFVAVCILCGKK